MATTTHGDLAAEAAAHVSKSFNAVEGFSGGPKEIRQQAACLAQWARERGVLLSPDYTAGLRKHEGTTAEHEVFYRELDNRAVKCTFPGTFGYANGPKGRQRAATPLFYLRRLQLMNRVFGADLRLEGVAMGRPRFCSEEAELPYVIISQRWVEAADANFPHPSDGEIAEFMEALGFQRLEDSCWRWRRDSDGIIVFDTKIDNFISSSIGIIPIDLLVSLD